MKKERPRPLLLPTLPTKAELRDECPVSLDVVAPKIIEQSPAATHKHQEASAGVVILAVGLQVLGQVFNAPRQQCYLHFGRSGIGTVPPVFANSR